MGHLHQESLFVCPGAFKILILFNKPLSEGHCKCGAHDDNGESGTKLTRKIHAFFVVGFEREIACTVQRDITPNVLRSEELYEITEILNTLLFDIGGIKKVLEDMYIFYLNYSKTKNWTCHLRYGSAHRQSNFLCPTNHYFLPITFGGSGLVTQNFATNSLLSDLSLPSWNACDSYYNHYLNQAEMHRYNLHNSRQKPYHLRSTAY